MMIAKDYIDSKAFAAEKYKEHVVSVSDAYKAVDMAKNEFAESIIRMINNYQEQKTKGNIADYVKSYCEGYCEGMINFIQ